MAVVTVYELIPRRALVTRESAHVIARAIAEAGSGNSDTLVLDFAGIQAVTPSFVDEILDICAKTLSKRSAGGALLAVVNPPTRLSSKFTAIARGRGMTILESSDGTWTIRAEAPKTSP